MGMEESVAKRNLAQCRHELENSADVVRRFTLLRWLVQEERKLGFTKVQLHEVEQQVATIKEITGKQLETIAVLKADGRPFERAEHALSNLLNLLEPPVDISWDHGWKV